MERFENKGIKILVDDRAKTILEDIFQGTALSVPGFHQRWDAVTLSNGLCERGEVHIRQMECRGIDHIRKLLDQDRFAYRAADILDSFVYLSKVVDRLGWYYCFPWLELVP